MAFVNATVLVFRCDKTGQSYGVRVQKMSNGDWVRTWSFPLQEEAIQFEKYEKQKIVGNFDCTEEYQGCPYCGAFGFVKCGSCGKISCYRKDMKEFFTCQWCGDSGGVSEAKDGFDVAGSGF